MTEQEELEIISYSLLKHMMEDTQLAKKTPIEIYNEWASSSNININYQNNLKWALRFIKAKKGSPILKSKALSTIVYEKEKKQNGFN